MARTSAKTEARRRARARLAEKAEGRKKREQAELEHITDFETALSRRGQAEEDMAAAVASLLVLGNNVADTAALTEQTEAEIRRLRKLAAERDTVEPEPEPSGNGDRATTWPPARSHQSDDEDRQSTLAFDTAAGSPAQR
jgi:hypothetical protein